jgi:hypothetical protein
MNIADLIFDEKMIMIMTSGLTFYKKNQHDHDCDIWSKHLIKKKQHDHDRDIWSKHLIKKCDHD